MPKLRSGKRYSTTTVAASPAQAASISERIAASRVRNTAYNNVVSARDELIDDQLSVAFTLELFAQPCFVKTFLSELEKNKLSFVALSQAAKPTDIASEQSSERTVLEGLFRSISAKTYESYAKIYPSRMTQSEYTTRGKQRIRNRLLNHVFRVAIEKPPRSLTSYVELLAHYPCVDSTLVEELADEYRTAGDKVERSKGKYNLSGTKLDYIQFPQRCNYRNFDFSNCSMRYARFGGSSNTGDCLRMHAPGCDFEKAHFGPVCCVKEMKIDGSSLKRANVTGFVHRLNGSWSCASAKNCDWTDAFARKDGTRHKGRALYNLIMSDSSGYEPVKGFICHGRILTLGLDPEIWDDDDGDE